MAKKAEKAKIVVIGGGTGTSVVLSALQAENKYSLTAIVAVSDSGGSTGRLRDEFGFLPVGDLRQCLAAMASGNLQKEIRQVLLYRFEKGSGLRGHNLGNLILTALEDLHDSPGKAIELASKIFRIQGHVFPVTEKAVQLVIEYQDGTVKIGEHLLDKPEFGGQKINQIKISPHAKIYSKAEQAIKKADLIILGPGDLYASLLPNTLVKGFTEALKKSKAKFVYIVNLMTHFSQTHDMTAQDHLDKVIRYCCRQPDVVITNKDGFSEKMLKIYASQKEYPVENDLDETDDYLLISQNLASSVVKKQNQADEVPRSLLRHDGGKLAEIIGELAV